MNPPSSFIVETDVEGKITQTNHSASTLMSLKVGDNFIERFILNEKVKSSLNSWAKGSRSSVSTFTADLVTSFEVSSGSSNPRKFSRTIESFVISMEPIFDASYYIQGASFVCIRKPEEMKPNNVLIPGNTSIADWILDQIANTSVIATDLTGRITYWNRGASMLYGWTSEEVIGKLIVEVTPSKMSKQQGEDILASLTQGKIWSGEFEVRRKDNSNFIAHVIDAPMRDENKNLVGIIGISQDQTAQVNQREELLRLKTFLEEEIAQRTFQLRDTNEKLIQENAERRKAQEELELLSVVAKKTDAGVLITNDQLVVKFVNDSFCRISGFTPDELRERNPLEILQIMRCSSDSMHTATSDIASKKPVAMRMGYLHRSGEARVAQLDTNIVSDELGHMVHTVLLIHDVTEKVRAEEAIKKANEEAYANKLKTEYITTLSHELRTPLHAIIGMTSLMKLGDLTKQDQIKNDLETIQCCSEMLLLLVNNVLDLRKIESGKFEIASEPFQLPACVRDVVRACEPLSAQKSVLIRVHYQCDIEYVIGDPTKLKQVLVNLCANAIKFTADCSEIQVKVHLVESLDECVLLQFSVQDQGPGIPIEKQDKLFKKFSQLHDVGSQTSGSGLGLNISKHLVELMQGGIWVESEVGRGSTFCFTVKLKKVSSKEQDIMKRQKGENSAIKDFDIKILVVEDNPVNQKVLTRMLERIKLSCDIACNGLEAIEKQLANHYDLIFMDVMMPEMNGIESTKRILQNNVGLPPCIIGLTANATHDYVKSCKDSGMSEVLIKPTSLEKIQLAIVNFVSQRHHFKFRRIN